MKKIEFTRPILLPNCWQDLLQTPDFRDLDEHCFPRRPPIRDDGAYFTVLDPRGYRYDNRVICYEEQDFRVTFRLTSGGANYWLIDHVFEKRQLAFDEWALRYGGEASFSLPAPDSTGIEYDLDDGRILVVPIRRIGV